MYSIAALRYSWICTFVAPAPPGMVNAETRGGCKGALYQLLARANGTTQ